MRLIRRVLRSRSRGDEGRQRDRDGRSTDKPCVHLTLASFESPACESIGDGNADYTRSEEGYPALVSNGGLSMHLMVDAALRHGQGALAGYTARLVHPLWVGDRLEVRGEAQKGGTMKIWAADKNGVLCGEMDLEFKS